MTKQEELTYLFGILSEASKWTASADDNRDLVRMEVEERIHNLINGVEPEPDENGLIQSSIHPDNPVDEPLTGADYQALEAQHLNDYIEKKRNKNLANDKWKKDKVRVRNANTGKWEWHPRSQCHQEKRFPDKPDSDSFKWVWDGPGEHVDKLGDELWAAHEAGENN